MTGKIKTSSTAILAALAFSAFFFAAAKPALAETRVITLTVTDGKLDINGSSYMIWKYNDKFPGPEIRVKEGDTIKFHLVNQSNGKHGIFFHGVNVTPRVSREEQEIEVEPGYEYTYSEFIAAPVGTHMYHCSINMAEHISRGLYGAFIVEPKDGKLEKGEPKYDKEATFIFSDWNPTGESAHHTMGVGHPGTMLDNNVTTINDTIIHGDNPVVINAKKGERIKFRLGNLGMLPHKITLAQGFLKTHEDGYSLPEPEMANSVILYAGKTTDIVVTAKKPGKLAFIHKIELPTATIAKLIEQNSPAMIHPGGMEHNHGGAQEGVHNERTANLPGDVDAVMGSGLIDGSSMPDEHGAKHVKHPKKGHVHDERAGLMAAGGPVVDQLKILEKETTAFEMDITAK